MSPRDLFNPDCHIKELINGVYFGLNGENRQENIVYYWDELWGLKRILCIIGYK